MATILNGLAIIILGLALYNHMVNGPHKKSKPLTPVDVQKMRDLEDENANLKLLLWEIRKQSK